MSVFHLRTPVAFIIFNRPETTERVFHEIARAKPPKLLVVADGPRAGRAGEAEKVAATRAIIDKVDWDCEVIKHYSDINLGCKGRESSGIDWIFEQVESAIILEDDCLPHPTFFRYCEELLARYRDDQRVSIISGDNFQMGYRLSSDSYYFSRYCHSWGWASWRDRWQDHYDVEMKLWPRFRDEGRIVDCFVSKAEQRYWSNIFERTFRGEIDTYDYQWYFSFLLGGRSAILPNVNLISNIGFDANATHTTEASVLSNLPVEAMHFPLEHPDGMVASRILDKRFFDRHGIQPLRRRLTGKVRRVLKKAVARA